MYPQINFLPAVAVVTGRWTMGLHRLGQWLSYQTSFLDRSPVPPRREVWALNPMEGRTRIRTGQGSNGSNQSLGFGSVPVELFGSIPCRIVIIPGFKKAWLCMATSQHRLKAKRGNLKLVKWCDAFQG